MHSDIAAVRKPKWYLLGTEGAIIGTWRDVTVHEIDPVLYFHDHEIPATEMTPELTLHHRERTGELVSRKIAIPKRQDYLFHRNLADHLLIGEPLAAPLEDSIRVVAILEAAARSAARADGGGVLMPARVRWGILGNATIARVCVIPAMQKSRNGTVHALGTRFPAAAAEVADKNDIIIIYGSYEAVLADPEIDAVYIPLPNHLHLPWTLKALQAGKHVLCEKPLACSAREARAMADAAADAGLLLMEAFMYRFHPRSLKIKQLIADGFIGTPCLVRSAFCFHIGEELLATGTTTASGLMTGGGALLDVGCYGVSLARWLLDAEPARCRPRQSIIAAVLIYTSSAALRFPGSELATFEASFISALQQTFTVVGQPRGHRAAS